MTREIEGTATSEDAVEPAAAPAATAIAGRYFRAAFGFLVLGALLLLVIAIKRVAPEFLSGSGVTSYGRLVPAATTLLLHGWLTIGLLGALFYIVPRAANTDSARPGLGNGALALLTLAGLGGAAGVLLGFTEGRRYLEPVLVVDVVTLLGLLAAARAIIRMARRAAGSSPVTWYAVAAVVSLVLTHIGGNVPGLTGYASQLQTSFYRSTLIGLWFAAATIAIAYYVVPRLAGRPPFEGTRLSLVGLWSLGFVWAMTGPAELTFGAGGDWLETIGVIFSIGLFLPVLVVAADLAEVLRGAWSNVRDAATLRLVTAGLTMFAIYALMNLLQSLRASAAIVGFTDWVSAIELVVIFGPFALVLLGLVRMAAADVFSGPPRRGTAGLRVLLLGLVVTVGAMAVAGVQTGFTWAGGANTAGFLNVGDGWSSTAVPLQGNYVVQLVGLAILVVGAIISIVGAMRPGKESLDAEPRPAPTPIPDLVLAAGPTTAKVIRYAFGFFGLAALVVFVLPALETAEPTLLADNSRTYESGSLLANGRAVYIQEGCAYCHTQQVRPIVTDVGLGPVSVPGDYAKETPALIGVQRHGPDLMHIGQRVDAETIDGHIQDPRQARSWSIMPSYDYLSVDDQAALIAYLIGEE